MTDADHFALWRECAGVAPDYVGPVEPPMIRWLRRGSPKSAWEIAVGARAAKTPGRPTQLLFDFEAAA